MLKVVSFQLLIISLFILTCVCATYNGFSTCNCDEESNLWNIETVMEGQRVGDFLIAMAHLLIHIELVYFAICSKFPFKWVLFHFMAFIALYGMTHLLNGWTDGPHDYKYMVAITVFKFLTALVSLSTSIILVTLIPMLLKAKIREMMLKKKTRDLRREIGIMMKINQASKRVTMLTQEIRKSLDKHKILYTTLVELSKTLGLQNCAVWMPNAEKTEMILTCEWNGTNVNCSIPRSDPDVVRIKESDEVNIIDSDSVLATASSGVFGVAGPVAAIQIPMLRVSNFRGETPELRQTCYAILVLVLPMTEPKSWCSEELQIIKSVVDHVAVALSHAVILEESQVMREKLEEKNQALLDAKMNAVMANQARASFQKVVCDGMRRPVHSILGLLSVLLDENLKSEQKIILDSILRTSSILTNLIDDAVANSASDDGSFPLEMKPFGLHALVTEAACLANLMCVYRGFGFVVDVDKSLPENVIGDEKRVFQVIMHMIWSAINYNNGGLALVFRVFAEAESQGMNDYGWTTWRPLTFNWDLNIRFEIGINIGDPQLESSVALGKLAGTKRASDWVEGRFNFGICNRIIQMMQGNISSVPNAQGFPQAMALSLRLQLKEPMPISITEAGESSDSSNSTSFFTGLHVLLADSNDVNRVVTQKLLKKLGCFVTSVPSALECLSIIALARSSIQVVLLDLHLPGLDGFQVAMRILKFRTQNWPVIVALSATTDEQERCMQIGMNGVIRKPVLLDGIASELRKILVQEIVKTKKAFAASSSTYNNVLRN